MPAANAVDGDASTAWCPAAGAATLVVDLGAQRRLDGVGLTLAATDTPATVSVAVAGSSRRWRTVVGSSQAFAPGIAGYAALPEETAQVRFARLSVTSSDGAPAAL